MSTRGNAEALIDENQIDIANAIGARQCPDGSMITPALPASKAARKLYVATLAQRSSALTRKSVAIVVDMRMRRARLWESRSGIVRAVTRLRRESRNAILMVGSFLLSL
jgi:hypothetical protein